ncbi:MAG TPA: sulfite exporter TauE/SafE family protein [Hyphomicrobiaceae bacterium]|nr:sulfite exporter TauE/SafE family protein [Hyphomicrobiaceae bacterium]
MQLYLPLAEMSVNLFLLLGMGLAVGFLSGMFGIGGGFILTPMLIFLGVPPALAVGTGASQVVASSVSSALKHWQRDNVDLKMGAFLIAGGLVGALSGVQVVSWLRAAGQLDLFVSLSYIVLLGVIGTLMLIESLRTMHAAQAQSGPVRRGKHHSWIQGLPLKQRFPASRLYISTIPPVAIGIFVGWLTAIMGIGGGFLLVPALIYLLGMPTRIVIGTSVFQVVFVTALTTVLQAVQNNAVDLVLGIPLMLGGVIGANYGVDLAERLKAEQLRVLLALLVIAVAIRMAIGLVVTPRELYSIEQAPPAEVAGQPAPRPRATVRNP